MQEICVWDPWPQRRRRQQQGLRLERKIREWPWHLVQRSTFHHTRLSEHREINYWKSDSLTKGTEYRQAAETNILKIASQAVNIWKESLGNIILTSGGIKSPSMVKERQCNGSLNSDEKGTLKPLVLKPLKGIGPKNLNAMLCSRALGIVLWASNLLGLASSK